MKHWAMVTLVVALCLVFPVIASAEPILYTLSTDYTGIKGLPAGSTVSWQFEVPSILTTPTTITSFISASLGSGLSTCGGVLDAQLPFPAPSPYTSYVITDFKGSCFGGINGAAAFFNGDLLNPGFVHIAHQFSTGEKIGALTIAAVPEPTTIAMFGAGLLGILSRSYYSRKSKAIQLSCSTRQAGPNSGL